MNLKQLPKYKLATYSFFAVIFIFSQFIIPWNSYREIFPLFHWSLFSDTPHFVENYSIIVTEMNGERLKAPCDYSACALSPELPKKWLFYLIQDLGRAIEQKKTQRVNSLRAQVESVLFSGTNSGYSYDIVRKEIDPLDYLRTGSVHNVKTVMTFPEEGTSP